MDKDFGIKDSALADIIDLKAAFGKSAVRNDFGIFADLDLSEVGNIGSPGKAPTRRL
jgi:hypothetical protein